MLAKYSIVSKETVAIYHDLLYQICIYL